MSEEAVSTVCHVELISDIVSAYVSRNNVSMGELPALIQSLHATLVGLGKPAEPEVVKLTPPIPIKKTLTPDAIISLEDGRPYKSLKRHLRKHGLTPDDYRRKWGLPSDYPMVAQSYAATRSELARSLGLGQMRRQRAAEKGAGEDAKIVDGPKRGRGRPSRSFAAG